MTYNQLKPFCDPSRHQIAEPYSRGAFTYATNGKVLVRVPRLPDQEESDLVPQTETVINKAKPDGEFSTVNADDLPPQKIVICSTCNGQGRDDNGIPCDYCDDEKQWPDGLPVKFGPQIVNAELLRLLCTLPGFELANGACPDNNSYLVLPFRFRGGDGVLIPMRECTPLKVIKP